MAFGKQRIMVSDLGAGYIGRYTMFYICEMSGKSYFGHDGDLMLMKKKKTS